MRQQAKESIARYVDERLPEEYEKCLVGLNSILKEAWITSQSAGDRREKIHALSLAKECYAMKLDLLTNATVADDAIRFVSTRQKQLEEKAKSSSSITKNQDREDDVQGSEKDDKGQSGIAAATAATTTTNNQTF